MQINSSILAGVWRTSFLQNVFQAWRVVDPRGDSAFSTGLLQYETDHEPSW